MHTPDHAKPQALYPIKPESGKKRASFLLNAQVTGTGTHHTQSQAVLNNHHAASISSEIGQSVTKSAVDPSYNSN